VRTRRAPYRAAPGGKPLQLALLGAGGALLALVGVAVLFGLGALFLIAMGRVLPGVSADGLALGGHDAASATAALTAHGQAVRVRDGEREWLASSSALGLTLNAEATAMRALRFGREEGDLWQAIFGGGQVRPVFTVDTARAAAGLTALMPTVDLPARNATVRMDNGALVTVGAAVGRMLDVNATLARLADPGAELADGALDLVMIAVAPTITDAGPLLTRAQALLSAPLTINAYNPVYDNTIIWTILSETWAGWLTTENTAQGIVFALDEAALRAHLESLAANLPSDRGVRLDEAAAAVQAALRAGRTSSTVRVYNAPTQYRVQPGDTLGNIAWSLGVQAWRIERANTGANLGALYPGQVIAIPSKDDLLPLPVVPHKRIVVSIARQAIQVYENGQLRWDWPASTGIASSPTAPGVYQITSHEGTAYASNWNLYMPSFMSIYEAIPGFFNGIHGFPWRQGQQILWENALGMRVTYGCVLLSSANAARLYEWAEDGVVVEVQP
jgi:lipoprotein-anchoring transpeptidase ErfK/SrfK